jgi:hypothetical protein
VRVLLEPVLLERARRVLGHRALVLRGQGRLVLELLGRLVRRALLGRLWVAISSFLSVGLLCRRLWTGRL